MIFPEQMWKRGALPACNDGGSFGRQWLGTYDASCSPLSQTGRTPAPEQMCQATDCPALQCAQEAALPRRPEALSWACALAYPLGLIQRVGPWALQHPLLPSFSEAPHCWAEPPWKCLLLVTEVQCSASFWLLLVLQLLLQAMRPVQQQLWLGLLQLQSASASVPCALRRAPASVLLPPAASDLQCLKAVLLEWCWDCVLKGIMVYGAVTKRTWIVRPPRLFPLRSSTARLASSFNAKVAKPHPCGWSARLIFALGASDPNIQATLKACRSASCHTKVAPDAYLVTLPSAPEEEVFSQRPDVAQCPFEVLIIPVKAHSLHKDCSQIKLRGVSVCHGSSLFRYTTDRVPDGPLGLYKRNAKE